MEWLRLFLLAPIAGVVGALVFVVALKLHIELAIYIWGLIRGVVPRKDNAINLLVLAGQWLLLSLVGGGAVHLFQDVLNLPGSRSEAAVAAVIGLPLVVWGLARIPRSIRSIWREAMTPARAQLKGS
jgi:hypothetical protein